ncbi:MAG: HEAT repeat domain-containing protein [Myxococcota bacterium]
MNDTTPSPDADLRARLLDLLHDGQEERRRAAAVVIGATRLDDEPALDGLRESLKDKAPKVRAASARALGEIAPKTLVKDIKPLLKDSNDVVREAAKKVLAEGPGVQIEDLEKMLEARDEKQRLGAIAVLGARGGDEARRMLLGQLATGSAKIQEGVLDALAPHVSALSSDDVPHFLHEVDGFVGDLEDDGFALCAGTLVALLKDIEHGAVTGVLSRVAESSAPAEVRVRAIEVLRRAAHGHRGAQEHVFKTLVGVLEDPETPSNLLSASADTLGAMDLPIALEPRVRALTQAESTPVRRWAIRALGNLDTAPAARALALVAADGDPTDRALAIEAAAATVHGRRALAKGLVGAHDPERVRAVVAVLEPHVSDLTKSNLDALEDAVVVANPEVAELLLKLLKNRRGSGNLIERGEELKAGAQWTEAAELFRRIAGDTNPEAMFLLGVSELKLSKKTLGRGPSHDPAVATFRKMLKHPKFPTVDRLQDEPDLEPDELYYLGFSLAEDKSDAVRGLGGDILMGLAERHPDAPLGRKAQQKLRTMGWVE